MITEGILLYAFIATVVFFFVSAGLVSKRHHRPVMIAFFLALAWPVSLFALWTWAVWAAWKAIAEPGYETRDSERYDPENGYRWP